MASGPELPLIMPHLCPFKIVLHNTRALKWGIVSVYTTSTFWENRRNLAKTGVSRSRRDFATKYIWSICAKGVQTDHVLESVHITQLPGGHISPSQISKKFPQQSCGQIPLVFGISKSSRWKKWGASAALRELQCTLGTELKKSIALLFGLESKNVIKWNILFTPTFIPNSKVSDRFDQR